MASVEWLERAHHAQIGKICELMPALLATSVLEEEGLAEFDLDAKATIEITEVRENAAKAKINGADKNVKKGDAVRWVKP